VVIQAKSLLTAIKDAVVMCELRMVGTLRIASAKRSIKTWTPSPWLQHHQPSPIFTATIARYNRLIRQVSSFRFFAWIATGSASFTA